MFNFKFLIKSTTTLCLLSAPLYAMIPKEEGYVPHHSLSSSKDQPTEMEIERSSQVLSVIDMPTDVTKRILEEASKNMVPIHLTYVCKHWHVLLSEQKNPPFLGSLMRKCMGTWGKERVKNMVLKYKAGSNEELSVEFVKGTVDLTSIPAPHKISSITLDMNRFFRVDEGTEPEGKVNILFVSRQEVVDNIESIAQPFASILEEWNETYSVAMVWRLNVRKDLNRYDYRINVPLSSIASLNLLENWEKSKIHGSSGAASRSVRAKWHGIKDGENLHICIENKN